MARDFPYFDLEAYEGYPNYQYMNKKKESHCVGCRCKSKDIAELPLPLQDVEPKYRGEEDKQQSTGRQNYRLLLGREGTNSSWRRPRLSSDSLVNDLSWHQKQEKLLSWNKDTFHSLSPWKRGSSEPAVSELMGRCGNREDKQSHLYSNDCGIFSPWKRLRITSYSPESDVTPSKFINKVSDFIGWGGDEECSEKGIKESETKELSDIGFGSDEEINVQVYSQDEDDSEVFDKKDTKKFIDNVLSSSEHLTGESKKLDIDQRPNHHSVAMKEGSLSQRILPSTNAQCDFELRCKEYSLNEGSLLHSNSRQDHAYQPLHKPRRHSSGNAECSVGSQRPSLHSQRFAFMRDRIQQREECNVQTKTRSSSDNRVHPGNDSIKLKLDIHATVETSCEKQCSLSLPLETSTNDSEKNMDRKRGNNTCQYSIFSKFGKDLPYKKYRRASAKLENFISGGKSHTAAFSFTKSSLIPEGKLSKDQKSRGRRSFPFDERSSSYERNFSRDTCFSKADYNEHNLKKSLFMPGFIDTHCHLDFLFQKSKHEGSYSSFRSKCVGDDVYPVSYEGCVAVFCQPWTFKKISWWEDFLAESGVWVAFGCHPHYSDSFGKEEEVCLRIALQNSKAVALGEIGLDYSGRNNNSPEIQQSVFRQQLKIAVELNKPLVIHCRDAERDCLAIMKELVPSDYYIHRHCFTENWEIAQEWMNAFKNLYFGITALVTCKNTERGQKIIDVIKNMPLDRLLLETDAPYFRPYCYQGSGRFSNPGMAIHVAAQVAIIRHKSVQEVLTATRKNTRKLYGI